MLAQVAEPTNKEIVHLLKETLSGTPDAARAEPFTWIIGLLIASILLLFLFFGRRAMLDLMSFIREQTGQQKIMADECHKQAKESLKTVAECAAASAAAMHSVARTTENHSQVMERVIMKLGQP